MRSLVLGALGTLVALAACSDDTMMSTENPPVLWLALDGRETEVKLVGSEPQPF